MTARINTMPSEESDSLIEQRISTGRSERELEMPSMIWTVVCSVGFVAFGFLAYICHLKLVSPNLNVPEQNSTSAFVARASFCSLLGVSIWFAIDLALVISIIMLGRTDEKRRFSQITLTKNRWFIALVFTLGVLSLVVNVYDETVDLISQPTEPGTAEPNIKKAVEEAIVHSSEAQSITATTFIMRNLTRVLLACSTFLGILLVKTILVDGLNFKMLFKNYEARIQRNYEDTKLLEMLNRITGKRMTSDTEKWATFVFKTISPEKEFADLPTLEYFFGTGDARKILGRFDIGGGNKLTRDEFVLVYQEILNEERRINMGMTQKVSVVKKLDLILWCILVPIGVFTSMSMIGAIKDSTTIKGLTNFASFTNSIPAQMGVLVSSSFVFAPILGEVVKSLVFIFLVEAFDIGDRILVDGILHEVHDMGLLYTSFIVDKKISVIQNVKIMDKSIVNLRETKASRKSFEFTFSSSSDFKNKVESLKTEISKEIGANPKIYIGKFEVCGYRLEKNDCISVRIEVVFRVQNQNVKVLHAREDGFVMVLHGIFKDVGLALV